MKVKNTYFNEVDIEKAIEDSFQFGRSSYSYFYKQLTAIPEYRVAILTCIDCRILPNFFGLTEPGKAIIIRTAGALFTPDVLRSLLIAIHELNVEFIAVVGHNDCGGKLSENKMNNIIQKVSNETKLNAETILKILGKKSASEEFLGFDDEQKQVLRTVESIKTHPLISKLINVQGYIYDHSNGKIRKLT